MEIFSPTSLITNLVAFNSVGPKAKLPQPTRESDQVSVGMGFSGAEDVPVFGMPLEPKNH